MFDLANKDTPKFTQYLADFAACIKTKDGQDYNPTSLITYFTSLQRWLNNQAEKLFQRTCTKLPFTFDFMNSNSVHFKSVYNELNKTKIRSVMTYLSTETAIAIATASALTLIGVNNICLHL